MNPACIYVCLSNEVDVTHIFTVTQIPTVKIRFLFDIKSFTTATARAWTGGWQRTKTRNWTTVCNLYLYFFHVSVSFTNSSLVFSLYNVNHPSNLDSLESSQINFNFYVWYLKKPTVCDGQPGGCFESRPVYKGSGSLKHPQSFFSILCWNNEDNTHFCLCSDM